MSTNISGKKREDLLSKIAAIKTFIEKNADEKNASQLLGYLGELSREVNGKKYGLVFEEHREKIDELLEENAPVFIEDKKLFVDNGGELNFLLEGDNLASLKLLEKTHRGKIDVIYIDPPYNTGAKNWMYNNDYVDKDDSFRHSKFASLMKERLEIASVLLCKEGIIAIAIDDYEIQNVRLLCDDVFGENNRLTTCVVIHNPGGRQDDKFFATTHEYMLVYAKDSNSANIGFLDITDEKKAEYKENDEFGNYKLRSLIRTGAHSRPEERPGLSYPIYIDPNTLDISLIKSKEFSIELYPFDSAGKPRVWRWGPKTLMENKDKYIQCKRNGDNFALYVKERENDNKGYKPKTLWNNSNYSSATAIGQIKSIFNTPEGTLFDYPKSLFLMSDVVKILSKQNSTILDFFAGSGTTGHAVLKLNAEDGGHRKFILCTNSENNICRDITYQRLKTAITGKRKDKSKYSDGLPGSLKYFKTDFIPISEKMYYEYADELLLHVRELVELENAVNFDKDTSVAIVLNDDEMDEFIDKICHSESATNVASEFHESQTLNQVQGDKASGQGDRARGQTGTSTMLSDRRKTLSDRVKTLYLGHDVLLSSKQERILKAHNISVNVIPDYYYRELAL